MKALGQHASYKTDKNKNTNDGDAHRQWSYSYTAGESAN